MRIRQTMFAAALMGSALAFAQQGPPAGGRGGPDGPDGPPPPHPQARGARGANGDAPPVRGRGEEPPPPRGEGDGRGGRGGPGPGRGGMPMGALAGGQHGRWWANRELAEKIGLSTEQTKKMDDIFQQHRVALVDLNAAVQKAELTLEPLLSAEQPDEARIVAQIDRTAQARAELEKSHARVLLAIRRTMTAEQWKKLQAESQDRGGRGPGRPGPPHQ
jgi:Spy/CpxP family protein refolding chaperone